MRQIFHSEDDLGLQQNGAIEGLSSVDDAMAGHVGSKPLRTKQRTT
ncbi:hypothetical protein RLEG12_08270 (plasmid) [Rhizobium leguminosarum bv. trifolii CB782]|nr:hypothetical protein RLEG12_08270 [Rhizobium leguminosarum bv. trifolii CB782]